MITDDSEPASRNFSSRCEPGMPGSSTSSNTTSHGESPDSSLYIVVIASGAVSISTGSASRRFVTAAIIAGSSSMIRILSASTLVIAIGDQGRPGKRMQNVAPSGLPRYTIRPLCASHASRQK